MDLAAGPRAGDDRHLSPRSDPGYPDRAGRVGLALPGMVTAALTEVQPGDLLAGKYRIERVLGRGGMGVVVSAIHEQLGERVALKFLLPESATNAEAAARFLREARAAVKIRSEHVARVTDVGTLDSGSPYMVMEYLEGTDLAQYLESRGPLPIDEAVEYVLQASEALAEAHALGIIHRDLKPANLFRTERADGSPSIKLLDFGISKMVTLDGTMTRTSSMMGSPLYMAPEQMTSAKHVDPRADVWALGVILHELLTGGLPFMGDTLPELCAQILTERPRLLRELRPDAPEELEQIILGCLEREREKRCGSVAELAVALRPFASPRALVSVDRVSRVLGGQAPVASPPAVVAAQTSRNDATQAAWGDAGGTASSAKSRRLRRWGIGVAAALALGAAGAVLAWGGKTAPTVDGSPATVDVSEPGQETASSAAAPPVLVPSHEPSSDSKRDGEAEVSDPEPEPSATSAEPEQQPEKEQRTASPQAAATKSPAPRAATRTSPKTAAKPASSKATPPKIPTDFYLDRK